MRDGHASELVESWIDKLYTDFSAVAPQERGVRSTRPRGRAFLPMPLWFALGIGALATLGYMVAQADKRESKVIQAIPIAFVSAIVTAGLLVVVFLDNPYSDSNGSIRPTEMNRTLDRIDKGVEAPCDELGKPI